MTAYLLPALALLSAGCLIFAAIDALARYVVRKETGNEF